MRKHTDQKTPNTDIFHAMNVQILVLVAGYLVLVNIYMIEFLGTKWRTFAGVIPMWGLGVTFFGVAFKLLPNWRHLCMATGILGLPSLIIML